MDRSEILNLQESEIWRVLLGCLLTTQQPSGAGRPVDRLVNGRPFLLRLQVCRSAHSCEKLILRELTRFGGIRRTNTIARQAAANLAWLESGGWSVVSTTIRSLRDRVGSEEERHAAQVISDSLVGLGPKQSRNMLQWLGLTRYEIPLDSRVVRWLNDFGFPVRLSAVGLADPHYYDFILDGLQKLCEAAGLFPCELDAMIFAKNEPTEWDGSRPGRRSGRARPSLASGA